MVKAYFQRLKSTRKHQTSNETAKYGQRTELEQRWRSVTRNTIWRTTNEQLEEQSDANNNFKGNTVLD